jgi:hypothetical protein
MKIVFTIKSNNHDWFMISYKKVHAKLINRLGRSQSTYKLNRKFYYGLTSILKLIIV